MNVMQLYAIVPVAVVMILTLEKNEKQIGIVLSVLVSCFILWAAIFYLSPIIDFIRQIEALTLVDSEMFSILLKVTGIGIITEIASLICSDCGEASLGKAVQILGISITLCLSLPMFYALIALLQEILGEL